MAKLVRTLIKSSLAAAAFVALSSSALAVNISGGGTDQIFNAIQTTSGTAGQVIVITDSLTYTETKLLNIGPRSTSGYFPVAIEAAAGQTPTIQLSGPAGGFVCYAGAQTANHIGSAAGGRINIDAKAAAIGGTTGWLWFIGQSDGRVGQALVLTLENLNIDATTRLGEQIVFGAGGNDNPHTTTFPGLNMINCTYLGGAAGVGLASLYGWDAGTTNTVNITNCKFLDFEAAVDAGRYDISPVSSVVNITNSVLYTSPIGGPAGADSNTLIIRTNMWVNIDHSDIINDALGGGAGASRGIVGVSNNNPVVYIKNSIIEGDAGCAWLVGTPILTSVSDSNIHGRTFRSNFAPEVNSIDEWPVYAYYGLNTLDPNWFKLYNTSLSAFLGPSAPIGSQGVSNVSGVDAWTLY